MAAKHFTPAEWKMIGDALDSDPVKFGFPTRQYGSVVLGSFNIRKLGSAERRNQETWKFLAHVCRHFDLLAVQEIMDELSGLKTLMGYLGSDFGLIISDTTGVFPGSRGMGERLGFIFNWRMVERTQVATDITYDRTKIVEILTRNRQAVSRVMTKHQKSLDEIAAWEAAGKVGTEPKQSKVKIPFFMSFIRQPFCVSFRIRGHHGTEPYEFMAINAHLCYGTRAERRQEFDALMDWIIARVKKGDRAYCPNFILLGDLNLDFVDPATERPQIEDLIKTYNDETGPKVNVNFPFLDIHPGQAKPFRTNARMSETFDHIGLFSRDKWLPTFRANETMGQDPTGPDYGVFNFASLFCQTLEGMSVDALTDPTRKAAFYARFEHKVSDHMPLWLRLPLPENGV